MDDETIEVPLPEGTKPDPDTVTTQELPVVEPFPEVKIVSPVKVTLLPMHLRNDPILTMDAPKADTTPLFDQLYGPPERRTEHKRPRRQMPTGDKVLVGMAVAAVVMGGGVYGMVVYGWGAGDVPEAKPAVTHRAVPTVEAAEPDHSESPTHHARPTSSPTHYVPEPEHSIVVVAAPETHSPSVTPEETTAAPEPSPTPAKPSTPPPSPTTAPPSPTPAPTETRSPSPTLSITLPASPTNTQESP